MVNLLWLCSLCGVLLYWFMFVVKFMLCVGLVLLGFVGVIDILSFCSRVVLLDW